MTSKLTPILLALAAVIFSLLVTVLPFLLISQQVRDDYFLFRIVVNLLLVLLAFTNLASFLFIYRIRHDNETAYTAIWPSLTIMTWRFLGVAAAAHLIAWLTMFSSWMQILNIVVLLLTLGGWLILTAFFVFASSKEADKKHHPRAQPFK